MTTLAATRDILADLIAYPTVSADGNLELIAYAADLLSSAGATLSMSRDESGTKANIFATIGPDIDGGIVLSGHTDVVPADPAEWTGDPFAMRAAGNRLFGRGACDMKGFIAACLAFAPRFAQTKLERPIHFAFTYDEEIGCFGARALVEELRKAETLPSVAIIGEPTGMRVIEGHKGCYEYTVEFTGLEGHGSQPDLGVNAVEYAARYIMRLMHLGEQLKCRAPATSRFDPPWTTIQTGRIRGGSARNIIAGHCSVEWEMRPVQPSDACFVKNDIANYVDTVLKPAMKSVCADTDIVTRVIGEVEGLEVASQSEARRIVSELTGAQDADVAAFGTEAGLFQSCGISTVVCGPGSIEQAHKPDEFIETDQLQSCIDMLEKLRARLSA